MKKWSLYLFVILMSGAAFFLRADDDDDDDDPLSCSSCGSCGGMTQIDPPQIPPDPSFERTVDDAGIVCCEDEDPPFVVGTITLKNTGNTNAEFSFENNDVLTASPASGEVAAGEEVTIEITVQQCGWEEATIDYQWGAVDRDGEPYDEYWWNATATVRDNCAILSNAIARLGVTPGEDPDMKLAIMMCPIGVMVYHSADAIAQQIPMYWYTDSSFRAALRHRIALALLEQLYGNTDYPCGEGEFGYTVCPDMEDPLEEGDWLFAFNIFPEEIPLDDPEHYFQYGFVFDADGDQGNNYQGAPPYSNDFYDDTDLWYSVLYDPASGWSLEVMDATGGNPVAISSAARATIMGNTIMLAAPLSEFAVDDPWYRVTAFAHKGDWGMGEDEYWSGDVEPTVADGLDQVTVDLSE